MSQYQVMRSLMFVPGHDEKLLSKAGNSAADVLLLDLEDSVQPTKNKDLARERIKEHVTAGVFDSYTLFPRVNDRESGHLLKDVQALTIDGIDGFMYPKSQTAEDVAFFSRLLETIEYEKGFPVGRFKIIPLIETSGAVLNCSEICQASDRVVAIAFGCEDYLTDLGGVKDIEGRSIHTARALIAMAAKSNNVIPIDTVHIDVHNLEDLEYNLKIASEMGFEGMLALHPKEIELAHRYFTPSSELVTQARTMLHLAETIETEGKGVAILGGRFVGPPLVLAAKKLLARHEIIQKLGRTRT
jgi:citrate lyase subunit beta / citryl-CoA lyase